MMMDIFKKNQGKIIITEDIKKESRQYMKDNNPIGEFVDNYEESEEFVLQKNLYKEYSVWCVEMLKEAVSTKKFTEYLRQLKVKVKMDNNHGNKIYLRKNKE
jgi:phage/plasmid-associated DNA primase